MDRQSWNQRTQILLCLRLDLWLRMTTFLSWSHIGSLTGLPVRMHLATVRLSWNSGCFQEAQLFTPPFVGIGFSEQATAKQMEDSRLASLLIPATVFFVNQLFSYFKYEWVLLSLLVTLPRAGGFRRETKGIWENDPWNKNLGLGVQESEGCSILLGLLKFFAPTKLPLLSPLGLRDITWCPASNVQDSNTKH